MMTTMAIMIRAALVGSVASLWLLLAAGCSGGPGSTCTKDSECSAGLQCMTAPNQTGARGLCIYPPSSSLDGPGREARPVEARAADSSGDSSSAH